MMDSSDLEVGQEEAEAEAEENAETLEGSNEEDWDRGRGGRSSPAGPFRCC